MAKVGPNAVNLAIAEMIGQLLTFTTHPNVHANGSCSILSDTDSQDVAKSVGR